MNLSPPPDNVFTQRLGVCAVADQVGHHLAQIEAVVDAIAEGAEVLVGVLAELECPVRATDHGLEVAQHGVDPGELGQLARLALAHHHVRMRATGIDHTRKARQAVAAHVAAGQQVLARPIGDGLRGEAGNLVDLDEHWTAIVAGGHGCHDGHLVGRSAPARAGFLATEVGVIELNQAAERGLAVMRAHRGHQLLMDQPGGAVRGADLAHERQGRQPGLGLADQVDRQNPDAQGQIGAVEQGARGQRGLVPAGAALEEFARAMADDLVLSGVAARAPKPLRPAVRHQRLGALGFGAVAVEELGQEHAVLELDSVRGHRWLPFGDRGQLMRPVAHQMSLSELRD